MDTLPIQNYVCSITNLEYLGGEIAGKVLEVGNDVKTISEVQHGLNILSLSFAVNNQFFVERIRTHAFICFYRLQGDHVLGLSFMGGGFAEECVLDSRVR